MTRIITPLIAFLPSLLAVLYFGLIATDRFVSEAQFVVRTASRPAGGAGLGTLLQMTGLGRANDEVFAVQTFITSRNAVQQLAQRLPLREIYGRPNADLLTRYPSLVFGASDEELHRYLGWMISPIYNSTTGITTLRVQAFRPDDAREVAVALLELGEHTVNQMNERIREDAVRVAETETQRAEDRMIKAQQAITRFRNTELMIDPAGSSIIVSELVARLSADLAQVEALIRETAAAAATNPQLPSLRRRAEAIQAQIARERARISSGSDGLADKLAVYERLVLDREFAKQALAVAVRSLESAQNEGRRQQLYLERVVEPVTPDRSMVPDRLRMVLSTMGLNLVLAIAGWLVFSGWREHAAE